MPPIYFDLPLRTDMSSQTKHKRHLNNRIAIVIEDVADEPGVQNELNITNGTNKINDRNEETLPENVVEKYLQSILKPMNMMQVLFVCVKYKIWDNVITPNSRLYSILSVSASVILMAVMYILLFMSTNRTGVEFFDYFLLDMYNFILYFVGGFLNVFTNIEQRLNNVLFVLKIQNVHRILNVNGSSFKCFTITNWVCVLAINCFHFTWMCTYLFAFYETGIANIVSSYYCISFDINMIYATRSMKLVYESLKFWIEELQKSIYVDDADDDRYWDKMFGSYVDIVQVFQILEETFHRLVLFYIVHTTSNALFDIWIRVDLRSLAPGSGDIQYAFLTFISLTWVFKNLTLLSSLTIESERFYSAMAEVQSTCIQIITSGRCSETCKRFCKNIQRLQDARFKKMELCGLLTIDAVMIVDVLGFITTYTIVLLQFEFL